MSSISPESLSPQGFASPYPINDRDDGERSFGEGRGISPATTLAALVAGSFAVWLGVLLLLLS